MENMVPVNEILTEEITKLCYTLIPPGFHGDERSVRVKQENLSRLIDRLGEESSKAQGLNKVITTAEKLRNSQEHILYLLKDGSAKGGKGELTGLLKVGWKHLYLFDGQGKVREAEPLCILDFFVLPDRQRHGYGKLLFDHMLKDLEASPNSLAIDGPSSKMEDFLRKNYGIDRLIHQSNNFAISADFFSTVTDNKSGRNTPVVTQPVGRFAALKPQSAIAEVIHGRTYPDNGNKTTSGAASPEAHTEAAPMAHVNHDHPDVKTGNNQPLVESEPNGAKSDKEELADLQKSPERPSSLKVEPVSETPAPALSPAGSTSSRRDSQLTDRGYFDVKFYHNKLCKSGHNTPVVTRPVGRFAALKPQSAIAEVIHGRTYPDNGNRTTSGAASPEAHTEAAPMAHVNHDHPDVKTGNNQPLVESEPNGAKSDKEELADLQKSPERPSSLKVEPVSETPAPALSPAGSTSSRRDSQLTDRGYFDVKFYHNKLW